MSTPSVPSSPEPRRVIVPATNRRDWVIGLVVAILVLGAVGYGIFSMGSSSAKSGITGFVIEKNFTPREERQITLGGSQVQAQDIAGIYILQVKSRDGEVYHVGVAREDYDRVQVGDEYLIPRSSVVSE